MLRAAHQHELDGRLEQLLPACERDGASHGELAAKARCILDDYTHPPGNPIKGGEDLLYPRWEAEWNSPIEPGVLRGGWLWDEKVDRYPGDPLASALGEAFIAMVRLTLDRKAPYFQMKHRTELVRALRDYLAHQGYDIASDMTGDKPNPSTSTIEIKSLQRDVAKLKRAKKTKTKTEKIREQRNKFSGSRRPRKTWDEIFQAYRVKYPNDDSASPDTLRLSFERDPTDNRQ